MKEICSDCGQKFRKILYRVQSNETKHLVTFCNGCGWKYREKEDGLDIEVTRSKLICKYSRELNRYVDKSSFVDHIIKPQDQPSLF